MEAETTHTSNHSNQDVDSAEVAVVLAAELEPTICCRSERFDDLYDNFAAVLAEICKLYEDDRPIEAHRLLTELETCLTRYHTSSAHEGVTHAHKLAELEAQLHSQTILDIKQDATDIEQMLSQLDDVSDWTFVADHKGDKVWYKKEKNSPCWSFRLEGHIETPILHFLSCLNEVDLMPSWVPQMADAKDLKVLSRFRRLVCARFNLPWPVSNRDCAVYGTGCHIPDTKTIVILLRSVPFGPEFRGTSIPAPPDRTVRAWLNFGGFRMTVLSPTSCKVEAMFNADPLLSYVPHWAINWVSQMLCHFLLVKMRSQAAKVTGSVYEERIKHNRYVYEEIENRLEHIHTVASNLL
eukprot:GILK01011430.1.p1 GENE.GILK01011430.1~~GILK01011430.1.p1  ORF type:complete len:362 (-),score=31.75 GILK01011430.1:52-1107(-)